LNYLIALSFWIFAIWLIRRDTRQRDGISRAVWIPTLWVAILSSRPLSMWLGGGGAIDTLDGSPVDRLFYMTMIAASLYVLSKREVQWAQFFQRNWPLFLYYGYFLISTTWADSPVSSFKRWCKDLGNIFVALVILTETNPQQAFRAVFVRCAYVWIPLSVIFLRYFPGLGRNYLRGGQLEPIGVSTQKNSLGAMVLVCGLILFWDWFERTRPGQRPQKKFDRYLPLAIFLIGGYLLYLCDSKTSILCLGIGCLIFSTIKFPLLKDRINALGRYTLILVLTFFLVDWAFGVKDELVGRLGRDMTFTGRTEVWKVLLDLKTDPVLGTGFCSFWSNRDYLQQLPNWIAFSAHNGYLETYIDGGWIGIFFLSVLLLTSALRINRQLSYGGSFALVRFAVLVSTLIGNYSESNFGRMGPLWFIFLLCAIDTRYLLATTTESAPDPTEVEDAESERPRVHVHQPA
jgi:exopolysaccharide production protein ExoQ